MEERLKKSETLNPAASVRAPPSAGMLPANPKNASLQLEILPYAAVLTAAAMARRDPSSATEDAVRRVVSALGREGAGILAVEGVPRVEELRRQLLPMARELALMDHSERSKVLKVHGLGSDLPSKDPHRSVSSYAAQLQFSEQPPMEHRTEKVSSVEGLTVEGDQSETSPPSAANRGDSRFIVDCKKVGFTDTTAAGNAWKGNGRNENFLGLGSLFRQLGTELIDVCLLVARICDMGLGNGVEIEKAMSDAGGAKGRLIHYHARREWREIEAKRVKRKEGKSIKADSISQKVRNPEIPNNSFDNPKGSVRRQNCEGCRSVDSVKEREEREERAELSTGRKVLVEPPDLGPFWQQWHFDYGLLTALTSPVYLGPECRDREAEGVGEGGEAGRCRKVRKELGEGRTEGDRPTEGERLGGIELEGGDAVSGLQVLHQRTGMKVSMEIPLGCVAIQVGEAAQILSGGLLRAAPHCVLRPVESGTEEVSREMFVVFMQPSWGASLYPPPSFSRKDVLEGVKVGRENRVFFQRGCSEMRSPEASFSETSLSKMSFSEKGVSEVALVSEDISDKKDSLCRREKTVSGKGPASNAIMSNRESVREEKGGEGEGEGEGEEKEKERPSGGKSHQIDLIKRQENMFNREAALEDVVPPLAGRWKEGNTFAEFSKETTRQYYGAEGRQSNRV